MTTFFFVRHGQTAANKAGLKQGTINTPNTYLTDLGKEQARELADHFDFSQLDRLFVSPLVRTKQTAEILNKKASCRWKLMTGCLKSHTVIGTGRKMPN